MLRTGATFGFQEAVYTVSEGAGTVVLCVTYDREIPDGQTATITVATEGGSATGTFGAQYDVPVSVVDDCMYYYRCNLAISYVTVFHVPFH